MHLDNRYIAERRQVDPGQYDSWNERYAGDRYVVVDRQMPPFTWMMDLKFPFDAKGIAMAEQIVAHLNAAYKAGYNKHVQDVKDILNSFV